MFPVLPYIFLVFMAVACECFYDIQRRQLDELVCVGRVHRLRIQRYDFILLLLLDVITAAIVYFYQVWFYQHRGIHIIC